jgi:hypothetical protein
MRSFSSLISGALLGAALLVGSAASAGPGGNAAPKATFVKGDVDWSADGTTWAHVKRGADVAPGSLLKTGDGSRAELTFVDGSIVRVGPASQLKVGAAAFDATTKEVKVEATLVAGEAWAKVAKLVDDKSKFQVKTANAVAGVRGTVFRVNVDRDEATVVKVYNGAVAVAAPLLAGDTGDEASTSVIDPKRKPIAAPFKEVDKATFEKLLGKMMEVRIAKGKTIHDADPVAFTQDDDQKGEPEWVRWNSERDNGKSTEKSD